MKRGGGIHTVPVPRGDGWQFQVAGVVSQPFSTKRAAMKAARYLARRLKVEHTIHRLDGRISQKNSYGNDSCPPRDKR